MSKTVTINQDKLLMLKEVVASNEFVSHIPFLYHATPSCYIDSIKEFGLGGKIPEKRFWSYKGTPYENIKYGVFLATDEYVAESYLEASEEFEELCETYEEDLEIVVFRINTNDLDLSLLSEDENQIQEGDESERTYFYNGIIPFEKLEKITLYENVIKEAAPEVDEYEIGDEGSNPPVGGNFYHVNESTSFDSSEIGADIMRYYEDGIKPMGNVQYEGKRNASLVENYDFEVNSSEIDLSSFKKKHELVPNIWNPDGKLNSRIRLKLLDIADDFWEYVNLTWVKPSGIILTGSICNFNWSQYSDIDLHLIVDFDEIDEKIEFVKDYLDSKKNEWNNEHSGLQIMGYPVELYVQNLGEMPESNGIYDLEENDWIREPNPDDIKSIGLNKFSIKEKAAKIMTIIDDMYDALASTDDSHKIEQMGDDASYLWKKVKEMRKSSLEKNGESGSGNIVYKILRRTGYLDRLFKLSNVVYDKFNSITESTNVENIDIFSLAKERFGTTNDIRECGYVLPDGSMLDFSGRHMVTGDTDTSHLKGRRSVDHREIGDLVGNVRESIRKYSNAITLLKEEVVADGNSEHNPYKKRWEAERKALKDFICNFGKVMTSKENGKTYKVYYDKTLSQLIGYNYCICLQWDAVNLKPKSVLYIRALDKFTDKMFQANFDARGRDNMVGTYDDLSYQAQ